MTGGTQYEKRNGRGEGCGKDAPWKSPKADFSTSLGNPAKTRDSHFSHSLDCCWILFAWWTHWLRPKPAKMAPFITGPDTLRQSFLPSVYPSAIVFRPPWGEMQGGKICAVDILANQHSEFLHHHHHHMSMAISLLIGVLGSLIATGISAAIVLRRAFYIRERRAQPFLGKYAMLDPKTEKPYGGTVTVRPKQSSWDNSDTTAVLRAHATTAADQPEWNGTLEVRGLSEIARGYYLYANTTGGSLQFTLVGSDIREQGLPHHPDQKKFEVLLRRLP
jgi:hypothetical protein